MNKTSAKITGTLFTAVFIASMFTIVTPVGAARERYSTSTQVLEDLQQPWVHIVRDRHIYFTEFSDGVSTINRFNTRTGRVVELATVSGFVSFLQLDARLNLYYIVRDFLPGEPVQREEIYKLDRIRSAYVTEGTLLYVSEAPWKITHLTVDPRGNVYFSHVREGEPSKLYKIPSNTEEAEVLLTLNLWNLENVYVASKVRGEEKIYFTTISEAVTSIHMFDVRSGELTTVLEKSHEDFGYFAYLTLRGNGDLYYLYRERSEYDEPEQWGYLEIGKFTQKSLKSGGDPTVLYSQDFNKAVYVTTWIFGGRSFLKVSDEGDIFFTISLYDGTGYLGHVKYLYWLNPATGTLTELVSGTLDDFSVSFVIDRRQDVYYTNFYGNDMTRINFIARRR